MNTNIEDIIREKPHLADPFRFYQKDRTFIESARDLPITPGPDEKAIRPDLITGFSISFLDVMDLPAGALDPLKQAMELREIDFTRLPLHETPAFSLPYAEEDLSMMLVPVEQTLVSCLGDTIRSGGQDPGTRGNVRSATRSLSVTWTAEERGTDCLLLILRYDRTCAAVRLPGLSEDRDITAKETACSKGRKVSRS